MVLSGKADVMYALINKGNGKYYTSTVYARYQEMDENDEANCWGAYFIVLNEEKTALVKQYVYDAAAAPYLQRMVLITDGEQENWRVDSQSKLGEVKLADKESLLRMVEQGFVTRELLSLDEGYHFEAYPAIRTEKDIRNLMLVAGGFHDAYVERIEEKDDSVYVLFAGIWGGQLEMWFAGDAAYDMSSRSDREDDPYWFDAAMVREDGFIYLVDSENAMIETIDSGYCWFKARNVTYHVIPDGICLGIAEGGPG